MGLDCSVHCPPRHRLSVDFRVACWFWPMVGFCVALGLHIHILCRSSGAAISLQQAAVPIVVQNMARHMCAAEKIQARPSDCFIASQPQPRSSADLFKCGELWYVTTTDRGPNEVSARNIIQTYVASRLGLAPVYFASSDCFEHLAHLITLGSMSMIDEELKQLGRGWRYFSSLAVFSHTVRGLAKRVFHEWCKQHGPTSGMKFVHKLFPRCDSGRWNSTNDTELRIISCTQALFQPVLQSVLHQALSSDSCGSVGDTVWSTDGLDTTQLAESTKETKPPPPKKARAGKAAPAAPESSAAKAPKVRACDAEAADAVNGLSLQESAAYSRKIGKYRRSSLSCSADPLWWKLIQVMNCVKQPAVHLSSFLKKLCDKQQLTLHGNALTQLVHFKAEELMLECEGLVDSSALRFVLEHSDLNSKDQILGWHVEGGPGLGFELHSWAC